MRTIRVSCATGNPVVFTADSDLRLAGVVSMAPVFMTTDAFKANAGYVTLLHPDKDAVEDLLELQLFPQEDKTAPSIVQSKEITGLDIFIPQGTKIYFVADAAFVPAVVHLIFLD